MISWVGWVGGMTLTIPCELSLIDKEDGDKLDMLLISTSVTCQ